MSALIDDSQAEQAIDRMSRALVELIKVLGLDNRTTPIEIEDEAWEVVVRKPVPSEDLERNFSDPVSE